MQTHQKWQRIRAFYLAHHDAIMQSANEWGVDPYSWEEDAGVELTPIESAMWSDMRMEGAIFYPQYPILSFFVDFANPVAKVVIECDGAQFHLDKDKDRARDDALISAGWSVYRFTGGQCMQDCTESFDQDGVPIVELSHVQRELKSIVNIHGLRIGAGRGRSKTKGIA